MMRIQSDKLAMTLALTTVLAAGACGGTEEDRGVTVDDTAAGVVDSAPVTTARAVAVMLTDENIIALLDTTYDAMLEADQLALDRTDNAQVRQLASRVVTQNAASRRAVIATAQRLGVAPVLPDMAPITGHADAMALMRQRAGSDFDEIYLDQAAETRKELINEIDEALKVETRPDAVKQLLTQLKSQLEADVKTLDGLTTKGAAIERQRRQRPEFRFQNSEHLV
jgi:predicted outer membrane protein